MGSPGPRDQHRGRGNILYSSQKCACQGSLDETAAQCPWWGREAGIVLASMRLFFPSQAPGLVLGTMPAEGREETFTHLWPAKEDNRVREVPPPSSSSPRTMVRVQSPE